MTVSRRRINDIDLQGSFINDEKNRSFDGLLILFTLIISISFVGFCASWLPDPQLVGFFNFDSFLLAHRYSPNNTQGATI